MKHPWPAIAIALSGLCRAGDVELPPETATLKTSALPGYEIAAKKCAICHSVDYITLQPPAMSLRQWTAEIAKMQHAFGAAIDDQELKLIAVYLTTAYGDPTTVGATD